MKTAPPSPAMAVDRPLVFTVATFCSAHQISRTHLYTLDKSGNGPRRMKVGRRVLISAEAARDWREQMERSPSTFIR